MNETSTAQQETLGREIWRLHQLSAEAEQMFELTGGECTAESDMFEKWIADSSDTTLQALCDFRGEMDGRLLSIKREQERLAQAQERIESKIAWAKARVLDVMRHLGVRSKEVGTYHIIVRAGAERLESDPNTPPDVGLLQMIDETLVRVSEPVIRPDRAAILKAIKAGREIPGYIAVRGEESVTVK